MKRNLQAFVYPENGGYVAECPDLNAVTQGENIDQTLANLREVIALALEDEDPAEFGLAPDPTILVTMEMEPLSHAG